MEKLTQEEIRGLAPPGLFVNVVRGIKREFDCSIAVMFDVDESDLQRSLHTGKAMISDPAREAAYICKFIRNDPKLRERCGFSDRCAFEMAKEKILADPSYRGEQFRCTSLGLWEFVIPMYDQDSRTFIGVILGGQWRDKGNESEARALFSKYLEEHPELAPHKWELCERYVEVPDFDRDQLNAVMTACRTIAKDIVKVFQFYTNQKTALRKEQETRLKREASVAAIHRDLVTAQDLTEYWKSMPRIAQHLWQWLSVDWCLVLRQKQDLPGTTLPGIEEVGRAERGRGIKWKNQVNTEFADSGPFAGGDDIQGFFANATTNLVSAEALCQVFPVEDNLERPVAFLLMGSAPGHRNANPRYIETEGRVGEIKEVASVMGMRFRELAALRSERERVEQLQAAKDKLDAQVTLLQDTLMSLNHQLHGPLWMLSGVLANVRDLMLPSRSASLRNQIEVGLLVAQHGSLVSAGMASILASEQGRKQKSSIDTIDVEKELSKLADEMTKSFQCMDRTIDVCLKGSDPIMMAKLDFFFVFYSLLENALRYADPGNSIKVECSWRDRIERHCLTVCSIGPPIDPGEKERVFQKFWRHEDAWQDNDLGLGIGCWAARECMLRCGGDLYLEANGKHSVFVVVPPDSTQEKGER